MNRSPDFIATLKYFTTEQGGRKMAAFSNYFPQIKFSFSESIVGGRQKFIDKEIVNPGEDVVAEITLLTPEAFENMLKIGFNFEVREASHIVGTGIILEILNNDLLSK